MSTELEKARQRARYGTQDRAARAAAKHPTKPYDPVTRRCYDAVRNALKSGKLKKGSCVNCGETRTEAHHNDYAKPLDVVWLCRRCHRLLHRADDERGRIQSLLAKGIDELPTVGVCLENLGRIEDELLKRAETGLLRRAMARHNLESRVPGVSLIG